MKLKFFSDYTTSQDLLSNFKSKYKILDDQLTYTLADDYDVAIVFNKALEPIKRTAKIITIIQEPSWCEVHADNPFLKQSDFLIIHDPALFERLYNIKLGGKIIESPSFLFYYDRVDKSFFNHIVNIKKTKKISIIVSSLGFSRGNYRKRLNLLNQILKSDLDIDIYGRGLDITDSRYKGSLDYKHKGLIPYEYSIAIENSNEKNYITEKFIDCVLCNVYPIYNGAPNINEVYDDHYFAKIDLDSPTVIEDIKHLIAKPAPSSDVNKRIYLEKFNLYSKLKEIIFQD